MKSRIDSNSFVTIAFHNFFVNLNVWLAICHGLANRIRPEFSILRTSRPTFHFQNESPLDDIITSLTSEHGGNVSDQGVVCIFGSTTLSDPVLSSERTSTIQFIEIQEFCSFCHRQIEIDMDQL
jgi:hypothetical protein